MVLQRDVALFGLAVTGHLCKFAGCYQRVPLFTATRDADHLDAVQPMFDPIATDDDPRRVVLARRIQLLVFVWFVKSIQRARATSWR